MMKITKILMFVAASLPIFSACNVHAQDTANENAQTTATKICQIFQLTNMGRPQNRHDALVKVRGYLERQHARQCINRNLQKLGAQGDPCRAVSPKKYQECLQNSAALRGFVFWLFSINQFLDGTHWSDTKYGAEDVREFHQCSQLGLIDCVARRQERGAVAYNMCSLFLGC